QVAKTPVLNLGDGPAAGLDEGFQGVVEGFSLLRRDILPRNDDVLVERHRFLLPLGGRRGRRRKVRRLRWISGAAAGMVPDPLVFRERPLSVKRRADRGKRPRKQAA